MPLQQLTVGANTFNETSRGTYLHDGVLFGGPKLQVKIAPGVRSAKSKPPITAGSISLLQEVDVTLPDGSISRERGIVTIGFQLTDNFPVADADLNISDLSTFLTEGMFNRILSGAS